ncbi:polyketide synthase dehydratase domain-containing protein [Streptomyces albus]|nr:polyketide synthase dehydratase domain-containing protein [Streptomyces albus]
MAPADATPVDLDGFYERTEYGPLFQGLRAVWTRDDEVLAELELPARADDAALFGLHPALLTAALHAVEYVELKDADQGLLPFSWSGVTLHASGAARLRVRITKAGEDTVSIAAVDTAGLPVLSVESLALRPSGAARLLKPGTDRSTLLGLDWVPAEPTGPPPEAPGWPSAPTRSAPVRSWLSLDEVTEAGTQVLVPVPDGGEDPVTATHEATRATLALLQEWLDGPAQRAPSWSSSHAASWPPVPATPPPTWPGPRCGAWSAPPRPSTPAPSAWSTSNRAPRSPWRRSSPSTSRRPPSATDRSLSAASPNCPRPRRRTVRGTPTRSASPVAVPSW